MQWVYEQFVNNAQLMNKILVKYNEKTRRLWQKTAPEAYEIFPRSSSRFERKRPLPEREEALMYDFVIFALLEIKLLFLTEL